MTLLAASFEHAAEWLADVHASADSNCVCALVGNKSDLQHLRQVSTSRARTFAQQHGLLFDETSALDSSNVAPVFRSLLTDVYRRTIAGKQPINQVTTQRSPSGSWSSSGPSSPGSVDSLSTVIVTNDLPAQSKNQKLLNCC